MDIEEGEIMLQKRILRDLKHNLFRYLAILAIVVLSMAVVVGYGNTTFAVEGTIQKYWAINHVEDGEFSVYVPLTKEQDKELSDMGVRTEATFYIDLPAQKETKVRIFKDREYINQVNIEEGKGNPTQDEIVLEKLYAADNGFAVGDAITIGEQQYKVVGIGTVADYCHRVAEISDVGTDEKFGLGLVGAETFEKICAQKIKGTEVKYNYTYILNDESREKDLKKYLLDMKVDESKITDTYIKERIKDIKDVKKYINTGFSEMEEGSQQLTNGIMSMHQQMGASLPNNIMTGIGSLEQGGIELTAGIAQMHKEILDFIDDELDYEFNNLSAFQEAKTNTRVRDFVDSHQSFYMIALVAGVLLAILIAYILSIFAMHSIEKDSVVIGTLYAMGYRKKELVKHYIKLPVIVVSIGAVIGTFLGIYMTQSCIMPNYSHMEIATTYPMPLMIYGIGMPIFMVVVINLFVLSKNLSKEPLKLLRKERKADKVSTIDMGNIKFMQRFQLRQVLKDKRNNLIMIMGLGLAIIIMMLGISLYSSIVYYADSVTEDMQYNYMYVLKNPLEKQPANTETGYTKSFTIYCSMAGTDLPVVLQGVEEDSKYFKFANELEDDINKVYISDSAVVKYGYKVGDKVVFTDSLNNKDYAFTIAGTVSFKNGIYFFMNKEAMEEFFDPDGNANSEEEDKEAPYYNTLFSDEAVEIPSVMLSSTVEKQTVLKTARSWVDDTLGIIGMFLVMSIVIFILVMYLLVKNCIERATFSISLMKVFGFKEKEIEAMYLGSIKYFVALTILIIFPVGTVLMQYLIPAVNATMKSGMRCYMAWEEYLIMTGIIIGVYLLTRIFLGRKLKDVSFVEILKDRE